MYIAVIIILFSIQFLLFMRKIFNSLENAVVEITLFGGFKMEKTR